MRLSAAPPVSGLRSASVFCILPRPPFLVGRRPDPELGGVGRSDLGCPGGVVPPAGRDAGVTAAWAGVGEGSMEEVDMVLFGLLV